MDKPNDTIIEVANDGKEESFPLSSFFTDIKANGFTVTTQQVLHTHKVLMQYANWVKHEGELCNYLAPIFAGSEDEQVLFKKLFYKHFKTLPNPWQDAQKQHTSVEDKLKQHWKKYLTVYAILAILVIALIVKTSLYTPYFDATGIQISIVNKNNPEETGTEKHPLHVKAKESLELITVCRYKKTRSELETNVVFYWGDNSTKDPLPSHIYLAAGRYNLTAYVNVLYKNKTVKKDTLHLVVNVCSSENSLTINTTANTDQILVDKKIQFTANVKGSTGKIQWWLDGNKVRENNTITLLFKKATQHNLVCYVIYDSINSPCTLEQHIPLIIHNKIDTTTKTTVLQKDTMPAEKEIASVVTDDKRKRFLSELYKVLGTVFFLLSACFAFLYFKELKRVHKIRTRVLDKYKKLTALFENSSKPAMMPFKNKNYLPVEVSEINGITKLLRRRVKDTITFLHIDKTIKRAIERAGYFEPVKEARTRPSEYLILIDDTNTNDQQVKLFEYLLVMLKKHNVLVEKFYYRDNPDLFYNVHEPDGLSLEKLYAKHQRHIILILGSGYPFINAEEKQFDKKFAAALDHWKHKAIITPVSYLDWGREEKNILLPQIPVVPVDIEGLVLLAEMLAENENTIHLISRLNNCKGVFYATQNINFNDIETLKKYFNIPGWSATNEDGEPVNVLFEWLAALTIYPKLRWEITLAIGNAILERYDMHRQLDFTILLRMVRISWMKNGSIPEVLRAELLKNISLENEKVARETILELLKEIPQSEIENSAANQHEKEVQQIINEFSLYANDPVYYSAYKESMYIFKKLWDNNKLNDLPTTEYFKNPDKKWKTLINRQNEPSKPTYNAGANEYLNASEQEETILSKVYLVLTLISIAVWCTSLAALRVLYIWDKVL